LNYKGALIVAYIPEQLRYKFWVDDCSSVFNPLRRHLFGDGLRRVVVGKVVDNRISKDRTDFSVEPVGRFKLLFINIGFSTANISDDLTSLIGLFLNRHFVTFFQAL